MSVKTRDKAPSPKKAALQIEASVERIPNVPGPMHEPGPMIAMQRKKLKWSLTRLAEKSNVSISTISRIENGLISPTYAVLARLCEALEIRWADMLGEEEQRSATGCRVVNRAGSGVMHNTARGVYEWLGADLATKRMEPTIVDAIPDTGLRTLEGHEGEEFLLVLEGTIVFFMQDYAPLEMTQGDSVYFDASIPHAYYGITQPARFLSVVSRQRT
ncbi:XRE family transcriptional regulator [Pseudomonas sp. RC10]|uniref:helix-turn-helix domain-containing protein n=1 Tax=Pseudomonas bambusae TaxID=3139142 RepID=UPI003139C7D4